MVKKIFDKVHRLQIIIGEEIFQRLKALAFKDNKTIGELVRDAIDKMLETKKDLQG